MPLELVVAAASEHGGWHHQTIAKESQVNLVEIAQSAIDNLIGLLLAEGRTYLSEGKRAMARKDFEKVLSENSAYPGLREHLAAFES